MIRITDKAKCCGCTACANICPHNAIAMRPDALGFLYPEVDETKCTDCGLCEKVCSFHKNYDQSLNLPEPLAYAVRHKDMHEVETSRSGAAFIAISDWILEQGGIVYGAGYTDHFRVVHKRATTKDERNEFKGSKYVQSDLNTVFHQIRKDLMGGLPVLFSGTPCQTSGLASYVGKRLRDNLYLVDIVCHGVPGPYLWRDYLAYLEKKLGNKICWVNFRDKQEYGWAAHHETFKFANAERKMTYKFIFYQPIMFRYSCGICPFTNIKRPSDITLADFWGWEKSVPDFNKDDKGVSLVLCNTEKGRWLFEATKRDTNVVPVKLENCYQPNLQHPSPVHPQRMAFENDYRLKGFVFAMNKYGYMGWKFQLKKVKIKLKNAIKKITKQ